MSKQFERHAKSKWEWGTPPSRSAERSQAAAEDVRDPAKKAPARKDTRAWCRGKVGIEHIPVIVVDHSVPHFDRTDLRCKWRAYWDWKTEGAVVYWRCEHCEECINCGKVLRATVASRECPAYPGSAEQRAEAEAEIPGIERRHQEHVGRWARRRPTITGPQGYRRRRTQAPS